MADNKNKQVLIIDDQIDMLEAYYKQLADEYRVIKTNCPCEALKLIEFSQNSIDLIVLDYQRPGMTGFEMLHHLYRLKIDIPAILCSGFIPATPFPPSVVTALVKPFPLERLSSAVMQVLQQSSLDALSAEPNPGSQALTALEICLDSISVILAEAGCRHPQHLDEKSALAKFGSKEITGIFYLWKSIDHLREKLRDKMGWQSADE